MNKIQKKTNIKQIQVKTSARAHHINRMPTQPAKENALSGVSVEQFLKDFKSQKSQARSERSADSQTSTNIQRSSNLTYESFTNRYSNNNMVKSIGEGRNIGRQPQFPIQSFKVTVPMKKPNPDSSRSSDKFQKTLAIEPTAAMMNKVLRSMEAFQKGSAESSFENYIEGVAALNEQIDDVAKNMPNGVNKQIFTKFKSILSGLSKRCLIRLYQKEDELQQTADSNLKAASQQALQQLKVGYDKKLTRLMQLLHEKEAKERQVNKLLYCLRKGGVDIENVWNKYSKQADGKSSKYQASKKCRTDYE